MPREQFVGNPTLDTYGTCPTVTLEAPAGTGTEVYDVYVTNVGTGAMTFTFNFEGGVDGFSNARMPVEDHTTPGGVVTVESGEFFNLDTGGCLHIVLDKANATPATADITVTNGLKTHITAATTNNDYITLVGNVRPPA